MDATNEAQVNWVLSLKNPDYSLRDKLKKIPNQAFGCSMRDIKCQTEGKKRIVDFPIRDNPGDVSFNIPKKMS
jgi:hypothetical protein